MNVILGLYGAIGWNVKDAWLHGSGASLWIDGTHIASISEERLSRVKYDGNYPKNSIDYVLNVAGICHSDVTVIVFAEHVHERKFKDSKELLKKNFPNATIKSINHHFAHAAASYYTSGFDAANILSFDGSGNSYAGDSYETGFFGIAKGEKRIVRLRHFINSAEHRSRIEFNLGQTYNNFSRYCYQREFPKKREGNPYLSMETAPGKIMGLAGYGNPTKVIKLMDSLPIFDLVVDESNFPRVFDKNTKIDETLFNSYSPADIALYIQFNFEIALLQYLDKMLYKEENLCIGGGCGLNVLANRLLLSNGIFKNVYVFPATNDFGLCYGAAINEVVKTPGLINIKSIDNVAYLGKEYNNEEIDKVIENFEFNCDVEIAEVKDENFKSLCNLVAKDIKKGKVVGWFQGKSEFGPRALGNRSILANPMLGGMKDHLNENVKHREYWRPYAPVILQEECNKYFDFSKDQESPHMMFSAKVLVENLPAITHVDGTARVQTVKANENCRLTTLIESFQQLTTVPVLLNTSFNGGGEPIVETPLDALKSFNKMNIDVLVIGNHYVKKQNNKESVLWQ